MHYVEGLVGAGDGSGLAFVMKHKANSMAMNTSKLNEVWYVDSEASNHMMSHEEWFSYLEKPEKPGVVETGIDTPNTIKHVGEVPLKPCRTKREPDECHVRPDSHKESGVC